MLCTRSKVVLTAQPQVQYAPRTIRSSCFEGRLSPSSSLSVDQCWHPPKLCCHVQQVRPAPGSAPCLGNCVVGPKHLAHLHNNERLSLSSSNRMLYLGTPDGISKNIHGLMTKSFFGTNLIIKYGLLYICHAWHKRLRRCPQNG